MRIALCFSGNLRFLDECYPGIKNNIIDKFNCDIYGHFWWHESYKNQIFRFHSADRFENIDLDKKFISLYNPKKVIFEDQRKFTDVYTGGDNELCKGKRNIIWGQINYFNQQSQYYSKKQAVNMAVYSDIKYDIIISLRTDAIIDKTFFLSLKRLKYKNNICIASTEEGGRKFAGHEGNKPSDWFYLGEPEIMKKFTDALYDLLIIYRKPKLLHIQDYLQNIISHTKLNMTLFKSGTSILRPKSMFSSDPLFVSPEKYDDNFDMETKNWIDKDNKYLPYYAKYICFKEIECIICKSKNIKLHNNHIRKLKLSEFRIIRCYECSHIQLYPNDYDIKNYYDDDSQDKEALSLTNRDKDDWFNMVKNQAYRRYNILKENISLEGKNIIDIGGGYGDFVKIISENYPKNNLTILEPGKIRIDRCEKKLNINRINNILDKEFVKNHYEEFDIVTLFHVLEHVINPIEFIENCLKIAKKGGLIYIEVPNNNCDLVEKINYYRDNIWYMKSHISYFSPTILQLILNKNNIHNFEIKGFERYGYENWKNWIETGKPQDKVTYYDGIPKNEIEKDFYINRNLKSDCMYVIFNKSFL